MSTSKASAFDKAVTVLLSTAVIAMAFVLVSRELRGRSAELGPVSPPSYESGWEILLEHGTTIGDRQAPVQVIEFADLECPACAKYQAVLDSVAADFGDAVAVTYIHFPLPQHPSARSAALAAICADREGKFGPYIRAIYRNQDSLGMREYSSYGDDAGITDLARFEACLGDEALDSIIVNAESHARSFGVEATPTVIVNGWRYPATPNKRLLVELIEDLLEGRTPGAGGVNPTDSSKLDTSRT